MIVKNEEQFIERVIRNIQSITDEIIITDTGSTDRTLDIIKKFKLKLFHYRWKGDEAGARNFVISKCKTDWVLFIDADEFLDIRSCQRIRELISSENRYVAYRIILKQYLDSHVNFKNIHQQDYRSLYTLHTVIRIFKNGQRIFYSRPVYPSLDESLRGRSDKVGNSDIVFHHLDILRNKQKHLEKAKQYCHETFENFKSYPDNPEVNYVAAHYYMLRGGLDQAVKHYQKVLMLQPGHIKAKFSLGLTYVMLGKESAGMRLIRACSKNKNVHPWEADSYLNTAYRIIATRMVRK
jgi:glycosyltransferase involved in cell wall biosynthesis